MRTAEDIMSSEFDECSNLLSIKGELILIDFVKLSTLRADQNSSSDLFETALPFTIPHYIYVMLPREFFAVFKMQEKHLRYSMGPGHVVKMEHEFRAFKTHVAGFLSAVNDVKRFETWSAKGGGLFENAWDPFSKQFKVLSGFRGGFGTVFQAQRL